MIQVYAKITHYSAKVTRFYSVTFCYSEVVSVIFKFTSTKEDGSQCSKIVVSMFTSTNILEIFPNPRLMHVIRNV